jgi:RimJ/RimL family protein N-acetyltransferase
MEILPLRAGDAAAIHRDLLGDPEVARWFRDDGRTFTLAECEEMVIRKLAHRDAHRFGWALGWEDEACVGWACAQYCIVDGLTEVEIGWAVARSHWRRGLGTSLGRHALSEVSNLGLRSIVAYTREDNLASRALMSKLGLTYERDFVHPYDRFPHVLYRLPLPAGGDAGAAAA